MHHLTLFVIAGYLFTLLILSRIVGGTRDNDAFFRGNRQSPWWAVAFGMLGASISGITYVSVPGMVVGVQMTYLQMCLGFILGYFLVAFLLLPIYYKMNLTTIYTYLDHRFGFSAYKTGASFFFLSKLLGASIRLYLVCVILQNLIFDSYHIPFWLNTFIVLTFIWLYTRNSGIKTIVWSDCLQTVVLLTGLILIIYQLVSQMNLGFSDAVSAIRQNPMSHIFEFEDVNGKQYFWKQFISGIFTVVVMTGLDQDMMQKNLTCRTLKQSQLNMCVNGLLYTPVNFLFLCLGVLMVMFYQQTGMELPAKTDEILPTLCASGQLGQAALLFFALGITAAAFSSADSALTSLTTCCCVDILHKPDDERLRKIVHPLIAVCFMGFILLVRAVNSTNVIDAVYTVCSYTYGPLLGLFAFGLLTRLQPRGIWVPFICLLSPFLCYFMDVQMFEKFHYKFGYELLLCNGAITFLGLLLASAKFRTNNAGSNCNV